MSHRPHPCTGVATPATPPGTARRMNVRALTCNHFLMQSQGAVSHVRFHALAMAGRYGACGSGPLRRRIGVTHVGAARCVATADDTGLLGIVVVDDGGNIHSKSYVFRNSSWEGVFFNVCFNAHRINLHTKIQIVSLH